MVYNILFLSKFYPDTLLPEFLKQTKIGLDFAAHNLSMAICTGLKENDVAFDILNTPQLGSFPSFYKTPFIKGYKDRNTISVPYFNFVYFKRKSLELHVLKEMSKWCASHDGKKIVFLYNFNYVKVAKKIKAKYPDTKFCLLVTDLPEYMATKRNFFTRIIGMNNPYQKESAAEMYSAIDGFILLAKDMKERLPIKNKPWIQIEGIYNNEVQTESVDKYNRKVIMYTGNLGVRYGIADLLEAFSHIKSQEYELWVRGNGELEGLVKDKAEKDGRIKYIGRLSRKDLIQMQKKATLMVNPVHSSEEFSRYFFPSKTLEYLASGTPTLMSRLSCMPSEYNNYLFFFEDESIEGMAKKIQEICEKPQFELDEFGSKAADFIVKHKTPKPQMRKAIEFFKQL